MRPAPVAPSSPDASPVDRATAPRRRLAAGVGGLSFVVAVIGDPRPVALAAALAGAFTVAFIAFRHVLEEEPEQ
jgi:hypothetical protein